MYACMCVYKNMRKTCFVFRPTFCKCFMHMCHVRCTPNTSHGHILKSNVAVAAVPWMSVFNMCVWLVLWAWQIRQHRFE